MCGIIGIVGKQPVAERLLDSLQRLEYRGYDSAGIATIVEKTIDRRRAEGKLMQLAAVLKKAPLQGNTGIGHTRWATHGAPTKDNAHPHATDKVAVVHNGIIENFQSLRSELADKGYRFESDTDTEVVPILVTDFLDQGMDKHTAVHETLKKLEGAFALGIIFADDTEIMYAARRGSPLAVGYGDGEMYMGSDAIALSPFTSQLSYLEEGDWAKLTPKEVVIYNEAGNAIERPKIQSDVGGVAAGKENYRHFMEKEIHEQPKVIADTLHAFQRYNDDGLLLPDIPALTIDDIAKVTLVACGTSYYAAMVAKYWLEQYAQLHVETDIASEFRYRHHQLPENGVAIFISQSGETADSLAALRAAKAAGQYCITVVNVTESTMARESDLVLPTYAGPEIGVASTKAFTTQLIVLACLSLALGRKRNLLDDTETNRLMRALTEAPSKVSSLLLKSEEYIQTSHMLVETRDVLYLGRGTSYPIALEGALKLKEISYIHAEGYAAGEMKHGPIALIDEHVPIIVLAPSDSWQDKTISNLQEAKARGGKMIVITDAAGTEKIADPEITILTVPDCDPFVNPLLYSVPVQLLAYNTAVLKGTDVDQPRNLAKSVTVE